MLHHALIERGEGLGYRVTLLVLNASHYGVPQARERMFLIGVSGSAAVDVPATTAASPPTVRRRPRAPAALRRSPATTRSAPPA